MLPAEQAETHERRNRRGPHPRCEYQPAGFAPLVGLVRLHRLNHGQFGLLLRALGEYGLRVRPLRFGRRDDRLRHLRQQCVGKTFSRSGRWSGDRTLAPWSTPPPAIGMSRSPPFCTSGRSTFGIRSRFGRVALLPITRCKKSILFSLSDFTVSFTDSVSGGDGVAASLGGASVIRIRTREADLRQSLSFAASVSYASKLLAWGCRRRRRARSLPTTSPNAAGSAVNVSPSNFSTRHLQEAGRLRHKQVAELHAREPESASTFAPRDPVRTFRYRSSARRSAPACCRSHRARTRCPLAASAKRV